MVLEPAVIPVVRGRRLRVLTTAKVALGDHKVFILGGVVIGDLSMVRISSRFVLKGLDESLERFLHKGELRFTLRFLCVNIAL